jgi:hypothetical protein
MRRGRGGAKFSGGGRLGNSFLGTLSGSGGRLRRSSLGTLSGNDGRPRCSSLGILSGNCGRLAPSSLGPRSDGRLGTLSGGGERFGMLSASGGRFGTASGARRALDGGGGLPRVLRSGDGTLAMSTYVSLISPPMLERSIASTPATAGLGGGAPLRRKYEKISTTPASLGTWKPRYLQT